MRKVLYAFGAALMLAAAHLCAGEVAIVDGTIIDGNGGRPIEHGVIVIDSKRIVAVGDRSTFIPRGAKRVEATGKFIIPGLMDVGVYLVADYEPADTLIRYEGRYHEIAIESAQVALKNGVTTLIGLWGPRDDLIKARETINQGGAAGARIYFSGNVVGYDGPMSNDFLGDDSGVPIETFEPAVSRRFMDRVNARFTQDVGSELSSLAPEEIQRRIRNYANSGIDIISVAINAHRPGAFLYSAFSPRIQKTIVEEVHRAGRVAVGFNVGSDEAIVLALNAGVDVLHPCDGTLNGRPLPAETVELLARRQIPCSISPYTNEALAFFRGTSADHNSLPTAVESSDLNDQALIRAGVLTLMSTGGGLYSADTMATWIQRGIAMPDGQTLKLLGDGHFWWLQGAQDRGMQPMAALMSATRNVARAFKMDKELGTLEPGKLADLVILDKNPLENAKNYRGISLVMKEGRIVDRDALPAPRLLTTETLPNTPGS